jgi:futalosine hydrolase
MRILLVAATAGEIAPVVARFQHGAEREAKVVGYKYAGHAIDVVVTGVGMVATAAWCTRTLAASRYDLALNAGVCGSFDRTLHPGTVVHVVTDRIAELGAEDDELFLSVHDLGLAGEDDFPMTGGRLVNAQAPAIAALEALPAVHGITVGTSHGNTRSIAAIVQRLKPQVESMEGAAFMYACLIQGLPFAQVRAVSNIVETRNRAAWRLDEAIRNLADTTLAVIDRA